MPSSPVLEGAEAAIDLEFETQGVRRQLSFVAAAAESVDLDQLLGNRSVTTFVHTGTDNTHSSHLLKRLCQKQPRTRLREIGSFQTMTKEGQRPRFEHARMML